MKNSVMLTIASLLLLLFLTFHLAGDIVYGFEPGGLANLIVGVPFSVGWLYGKLVLSEQRSGYSIVFLVSLGAWAVRGVHVKWKAVGGASSVAGAIGHSVFVC